MNKNDKLPYFRPPTQRAEVPEDTEAGSEVFRLQAFDEDSAAESLVYSVMSPVTAINKDGQQMENQVGVNIQRQTALTNIRKFYYLMFV